MVSCCKWWYALTGDVQCGKLARLLTWDLKKIFYHSQQVPVFPQCRKLLTMAKRALLRRSCLTHYKILLRAPCVTPIIRAISTCWSPLRESLTMICNISPEIWRGIVWQNPDRHVISIDGIPVNLTSSIPSADLPHWFLTNLRIQSCMECICKTIPYRNPFILHPDIWIIC